MGLKEDREHFRKIGDAKRDNWAKDNLSEEELELYFSSEEAIRVRSHCFAFDREAFEARMRAGEDWHRVIQAHLYLDHTVTAILEESLGRPEAVRLSRMAFGQKLDLCEALGLLGKELSSVTSHLNRLRNKIAHQLNFRITDQDVSDLRNCTPNFIREAIVGVSTRGGGDLTLVELLQGVVFMVEITRQRLAVQRQLHSRGQLHLRVVLGAGDQMEERHDRCDGPLREARRNP